MIPHYAFHTPLYLITTLEANMMMLTRNMLTVLFFTAQASTHPHRLSNEHSNNRSQWNLTTPCNHTQRVRLSDTDEHPRSGSFAKLVYIACFVFGIIGLLMLVIMLATQFVMKHCASKRVKRSQQDRQVSQNSIGSEKLETLEGETWKEVE
jgi:hypothetical protein